MLARNLAAVMGVLALFLTGCSGSAASGTGETAVSAGDPIKVGVIPVADFAPVYIAIEEGYFAEEGLNVEAQVMQNAAAIAPSVLNGQLQFGTSAVTPFLAAAQKGLPIRAVANASDVAEHEEGDISGLLISEGSDVKRPADLEGKTVAVNALSSIVHVAAAHAIKGDGGDPSKVTFVAMPFPDMMVALSQGRIDAASVVEPFVTVGKSGGATKIANTYSQTFTPGGTVSLFFGADAYIRQNPELVKKFVTALERGSELAAKDPQKVSAVLTKYGQLKSDVSDKAGQPGYSTGVDSADLDTAAKVMQDLGFLPGPVDAAKLIWKKP